MDTSQDTRYGSGPQADPCPVKTVAPVTSERDQEPYADIPTPLVRIRKRSYPLGNIEKAIESGHL